jgi:hypothetical protein
VILNRKLQQITRGYIMACPYVGPSRSAFWTPDIQMYPQKGNRCCKFGFICGTAFFPSCRGSRSPMLWRWWVERNPPIVLGMVLWVLLLLLLSLLSFLLFLLFIIYDFLFLLHLLYLLSSLLLLLLCLPRYFISWILVVLRTITYRQLRKSRWKKGAESKLSAKKSWLVDRNSTHNGWRQVVWSTKNPRIGM